MYTCIYVYIYIYICIYVYIYIYILKHHYKESILHTGGVDSLKYSSKVEAPINMSAKAVISRNLTTSQNNHLFICYFLFLFFILFFMYLQKTGITVLSE